MNTRGFTIIELLIIVVVIGILASISVIAYNGIQNRTHDSTVQGDLQKIGTKAKDFNSVNFRYPNATQTDLQSLISVVKTSYLTNQVSGSMSYCRNDTKFTIYGRSLSRNAFVYSLQDGLKTVNATGNLIEQCALGGVAPADPGYGAIWLLKGTSNPEGGGWQTWIQG